jgi:hypothetical protein
MTFKTQFNCDIPSDTMAEYFSVLVGKIFKILPLAEDDKSSAQVYLSSLCFELRGVKRLLNILSDDPAFISLLGIIMELSQNIDKDEYTIKVIKREVFKAISICQKLEKITMSGSAEECGGDCDE